MAIREISQRKKSQRKRKANSYLQQIKFFVGENDPGYIWGMFNIRDFI